MGHAHLSLGTGHGIIRGPEVGHQHPIECSREELTQRGRAARLMNHIVCGSLCSKTPKPHAAAIDTPAGFVRVQHASLLDLFANALIPRQQHLRQPLPGIHRAAGGELEVEMMIQHREQLRDRHAQPVVQPSRQRHHPMAQFGFGHGVGNRRLHPFVTVSTPGARNAVANRLWLGLDDFLDEAEASLWTGRPEWLATVGTAAERSMVVLVRDVGWVLAALAGMARLGAPLVATFALGLLLVRRHHGRWRRRARSLFGLPDQARGHLEHDEDDGLFAQSVEGLGLLPRHGDRPFDRRLVRLRFHAGIL